MYGDSYQPENPETYETACKMFATCDNRKDLSTALMMCLMDPTFARPDMHVAHKRRCIEMGWE
jgi:hypothetical protein